MRFLIIAGLSRIFWVSWSSSFTKNRRQHI